MGVGSAGSRLPLRLPRRRVSSMARTAERPPAGMAVEQAQPPCPTSPPPELWAASPNTHFLADLFLGLSLTSTANQAPSDKALKSSA